MGGACFSLASVIRWPCWPREGDVVQAEQRYTLAVEMWQRAEFRPGLAVANHQLGMLHPTNQVQYLQAKRFFLKALKIKEGIGTPASLAHSLGQLAVLAQIVGEFAVAGERAGADTSKSEQDRRLCRIAICNQYLGNLACLQGDFAEAERRYAEAVDLSDALDNAAGVASRHSWAYCDPQHCRRERFSTS